MADITEILRQLAYYQAGGGKPSTAQEFGNFLTGTGQALGTAAKGFETGLELQKKRRELSPLSAILKDVPEDYSNLTIGEAKEFSPFIKALKGTPDIQISPAQQQMLGIEQSSLSPSQFKADVAIAGLKQKQDLAKASELSPEEIQFYGTQLRTGGNMPALGMGGMKLRAQIAKEAARQSLEIGQTPQATNFNKLAMSAYQAELSNLQKQRGVVLAFESTAEKNIDLALQQSGKVNRFGSPVVDRWKLAAQKQVFSDPDVAAMDAAVKVAANEIAKVTSTTTGNMIPEQERIEYRNLMNTALNMPAFEAVTDVVKQDMQNRNSSYQEQVDRIKQEVSEIGSVISKKPSTKEPAPMPSKKTGKIGIAIDANGNKARVEFDENGKIKRVLNEIR